MLLGISLSKKVSLVSPPSSVSVTTYEVWLTGCALFPYLQGLPRLLMVVLLLVLRNEGDAGAQPNREVAALVPPRSALTS